MDNSSKSPSDKRDLEIIINRIQNLRELAFALGDSSGALADRLYGSIPEVGADGPDQDCPAGVVAVINVNLDALEGAMRRALNNIKRMEIL